MHFSERDDKRRENEEREKVRKVKKNIISKVVIVIYCKYVEFTKKNNTRVYNTKKITDNIKII